VGTFFGPGIGAKLWFRVLQYGTRASNWAIDSTAAARHLAGKGIAMIDDEKEVAQLIRAMEGQLPIGVRPTRQLVETLTQGGMKCRPDEELQIASVLNLGDVGGIACGLKWPGAGKNAVVVSLTNLRVDDRHPLAARIGEYQFKRSANIARSADWPELPRRGVELRRKKRRHVGKRRP
jgi:hypothetical protein